MRSKRRPPTGKRINPNFWVFCEGETEDAYIRLLRSEYRLPIEIISKVAGDNINERYIKSYKRGKPTHEKDKDILVYDADVPEVLKKLKKIRSALLVASNPAIELWFLLHYKNQIASLNQGECIRQLSKRNRNLYRKGFIDAPLKDKLMEKRSEACKRSAKMELFGNPSTNMQDFIQYLEDARTS